MDRRSDAPPLVERASDAPSLVVRTNAKDEANAAADWLLARHESGIAWRDCVVLAPGKRNWRAPLAAALDGAGIPHRMMLGDPGRGPSATAIGCRS